MRGRIAFIVLAVLVTALVASLNWPEFTRAEPLSFGLFTATVPVGVTMLVLMAIVLTVFLVSSAIQESRYLLDHRRHTRALHAQRELAEKAEASRFTDLRQHLDLRLREIENRLDAHLRTLPRTDPLREPLGDSVWREGDPPLRTDPDRRDLAGRERV